MLNFQVHINGKRPKKFLLNGAYLFGHDDLALPGQISYENSQIQCTKHAPGLGGLSLLWPVQGTGQIMLPTTRLEERDEPYNLNVELARARLMRLLQKREDWGLLDYPDTEELDEATNKATDVFLEALSTEDDFAAAKAADKALAQAVAVSERWSDLCAKILTERRVQANAIHSTWIACGIEPSCNSQRCRKRLLQGFGYFYLPIYWKDVEPNEHQFNWQITDEWIAWLNEHRLPVRCGPLVSLSTRNLPDWVYLWENDFDGIRDLMYEHVQRVVSRYGNRVTAWDVVSGINAENPFKFTMEQLIELSRVAALATKRLVPRCSAILELVQPWGEYRAKDLQTILAAMFADMAVQSGVNFDAVGLQIHFGVGRQGLFVRDFFQVSSLLDEFASLGKPVHITGMEVPSDTGADPRDAWGGSVTTKTGGYWQRPWDAKLQAEWLEKFVNIAISKPFVESLCWSDLTDSHPHRLPHSGLLNADYSPKPAFKTLLKLSAEFGSAPNGSN